MPEHPSRLRQLISTSQGRRKSSAGPHPDANPAVVQHGSSAASGQDRSKKSFFRHLLGKSSFNQRHNDTSSHTSSKTIDPAQTSCDDSSISYGSLSPKGSIVDVQENPDGLANGAPYQHGRAKPRRGRPQTSDGLRKPSRSSFLPAAPLQRPGTKPGKLSWHSGPYGPELVTQTIQTGPAAQSSIDRRRFPPSGKPRSGYTSVSASLSTGETWASSSIPHDTADSYYTSGQPHHSHHHLLLSSPTLPPATTRIAQSQPACLPELRADGLVGREHSPVERATPPKPGSTDGNAGSGIGPASGHWTTALEPSAESSQVGLPLAEVAELLPTIHDVLEIVGTDSRPSLFEVKPDSPLVRPSDAFVQNGSASTVVRPSSNADAATTEPTHSIDDEGAQEAGSSRTPPHEAATEHFAKDDTRPTLEANANRKDTRADAARPAGSSQVHASEAAKPPLVVVAPQESLSAPVASTDLLQASCPDDGGGDSISPLSPPSRPSSISSAVTPRRISFAPSVRSRNRPAPKGLAPPGVASTSSRSSASSESGSDAEVTSSAEVESRLEGVSFGLSQRNRKRSKRPSTAPAALQGEDEGEGGSGSGSFKRYGASITDSDDDLGVERGLLTSSISRRRGRATRSKDEAIEPPRSSQTARSASLSGREAIEAEDTTNASGDFEQTPAETADVDEEESRNDAQSGDTSQRQERELVFYPRTLILVREGVAVDDTDDGACTDARAPCEAEAEASNAEINGAAEIKDRGEPRGGLLGLKRWSANLRKASESSASETTTVAVSSTEGTREGFAAAAEAPARLALPHKGAESDATMVNSPSEQPQPQLATGSSSQGESGSAATATIAAYTRSPEAKALSDPASQVLPTAAGMATSTSPLSPPEVQCSQEPYLLSKATLQKPRTETTTSANPIDEDENQILWHGSPPARHGVKMHTRALRLLERVTRPSTATSHDATFVSASSKSRAKAKKAAEEGPMLRIISKEGQASAKSTTGILLPESLERSYYYPGRTQMDLDWRAP